jgi:hypothetical protein
MQDPKSEPIDAEDAFLRPLHTSRGTIVKATIRSSHCNVEVDIRGNICAIDGLEIEHQVGAYPWIVVIQEKRQIIDTVRFAAKLGSHSDEHVLKRDRGRGEREMIEFSSCSLRGISRYPQSPKCRLQVRDSSDTD